MFFHLGIAELALGLQPVSNLFAAFFRPDTVDFSAVAGADHNHLFDPFELVYFLDAISILRPGDGDLLASLKGRGVVTDSSGE
jgi:hypothetical protein